MANLDLRFFRSSKPAVTDFKVGSSALADEIQGVTELGSPRRDVFDGTRQTRLQSLSGRGSPEEQLVEVLTQIAKATPAYPGLRNLKLESAEKGKPSRPAVTRDPQRNEPRIDLAILQGHYAGNKTLGEVSQRNYAGAFRLWADTPHLDAWTSPFGQAFAQYSLHRYALGDELGETAGKIGHASAVTWYSRSLYADQTAAFEKKGLGPVLDDAWARRLDFAGVAHDVGYMHGGRNHPSKGAADMLANFGKYAENAGLLGANDPAQQVEIEKIAILAQMHGMSFPWDQIDQRLPGALYISVDVVEDIFKANGGAEKLKGIIRREYRDYLGEPGLPGQPAKLAWLDDPAELKALIRGGWIMHCADKDLGPRPNNGGLAGVRRALAQDAVPGRIGDERALSTIAELDNYFRAKGLSNGLRSGSIAGDLATQLSTLNRAILEGSAKLDGDAKDLAESLKKGRPADGVVKAPAWSPEVLALSTRFQRYARVMDTGFEYTGKAAPFSTMSGREIEAALKGPYEELKELLAKSTIPSFILEDLLDTGVFRNAYERDVSELNRAPDPR